jgi:hypothetical protein
MPALVAGIAYQSNALENEMAGTSPAMTKIEINGGPQTSSHSRRTPSLRSRSAGVPSNTIWPCPMT